MIYLDLDDLLYVATRVLPSVELVDVGLLESAVARPQVTVYGEDAYGDVHAKAGALLRSVARNHALVDGNKRLALAATIAFLGITGWQMTMTNDAAYDLVIALASGQLDLVAEIAGVLRANTVEQ